MITFFTRPARVAYRRRPSAECELNTSATNPDDVAAEGTRLATEVEADRIAAVGASSGAQRLTIVAEAGVLREEGVNEHDLSVDAMLRHEGYDFYSPSWRGHLAEMCTYVDWSGPSATTSRLSPDTSRQFYAEYFSSIYAPRAVLGAAP